MCGAHAAGGAVVRQQARAGGSAGMQAPSAGLHMSSPLFLFFNSHCAGMHRSWAHLCVLLSELRLAHVAVGGVLRVGHGGLCACIFCVCVCVFACLHSTGGHRVGHNWQACVLACLTAGCRREVQRCAWHCRSNALHRANKQGAGEGSAAARRDGGSHLGRSRLRRHVRHGRVWGVRGSIAQLCRG